MSTLNELKEISKNYSYSDGVMSNSINYSYNIFCRYANKGSILELGPAEGVMTDLIMKDFVDITVVEGSEIFCIELKKKYPTLKVINSLFESYLPDFKFDNIILGHVLEHVESPKDLLKKLKQWLNPKGVIFASVPNALSLHRQAAVLMGLLENESSLNLSDINHGHKRVFNLNDFINLFLVSDLNITKYGGYWLKPLSNIQIEESWSQEAIKAFMILGEKFPEIAAEIYVVASNNS
jgi:2-polyprenyl-3-methyl-5-hydroxy-6-metoxy-1,4-benzoquinol methylase